MAYLIGIDVGGTKIAGGLFSFDGKLLKQIISPTPNNYDSFIKEIINISLSLNKEVEEECKIGIGLPGAIGNNYKMECFGNINYLNQKPAYKDLKSKLKMDINFANDADCFALVEAIDGAGKGSNVVVGLIMGTGVGCGVIIDGKPLKSLNGLAGELGHAPLPFYKGEDGDGAICNSCRQTKCISSFMDGAALTRLSKRVIGKSLQPPEISDKAIKGDKDALMILDKYYDIVARAIIVPIYAYDPEIIVVGGGLNSLPNMYNEIPKRLGKYCIIENIKTKFVPAVYGSMSGMRGAALLWKD